MVRKIVYTAITMLLLWCFIDGIPLDFYAQHIAALSYLGGGLITIALTVTMIKLIPQKAMDNEEESSGMGYILSIISIGAFLGISYFLQDNAGKRVVAEYRDHGVTTTATVDDGSSFGNSDFDFTSIRVRFTDEAGKTRYGFIDIGAEAFKKHYMYEKLTILYSRRYPTMVKIVTKI